MYRDMKPGFAMWALGLVGVGAVALGVSPLEPSALRTSLSRARVVQAGDSIAVQHVIRWSDDGNGGPDSLVVTESATGRGQQRRVYRTPAAPVNVSFMWVSPAPGDSVSGTITAQLFRRRMQGGLASRQWQYRRSDVAPPTPVIDTSLTIAALRLEPNAITLEPGTSRQLCPLFYFGDGRVVLRSTDVSACGSIYTSATTASERAVTAAQQAIADAVCLSWQAAGGTVEVAGCDRLVSP